MINRRKFLLTAGAGLLAAACGNGGGNDHAPQVTYSFNPLEDTTTKPALVVSNGKVTDATVDRVAYLTSPAENHEILLIYNGPDAEQNFYDNITFSEDPHGKFVTAYPQIRLDDGLFAINPTPVACQYDQANIGSAVMRLLSTPETGVDAGNNADLIGFSFPADTIDGCCCLSDLAEGAVKDVYSRMGHHVQTGVQEKLGYWVNDLDATVAGNVLVGGLGKIVIAGPGLSQERIKKDVSLEGLTVKTLDQGHTMYLS